MSAASNRDKLSMPSARRYLYAAHTDVCACVSSVGAITCSRVEAAMLDTS